MDIYTSIQKFGVNKICSCFWKVSYAQYCAVILLKFKITLLIFQNIISFPFLLYYSCNYLSFMLQNVFVLLIFIIISPFLVSLHVAKATGFAGFTSWTRVEILDITLHKCHGFTFEKWCILLFTSCLHFNITLKVV